MGWVEDPEIDPSKYKILKCGKRGIYIQWGKDGLFSK